MDDDMHMMDPTIAVRPDQWMKSQNLLNPMNPLSPLNPVNQNKETTETTEPAKADPVVGNDQLSAGMSGTIVWVALIVVVVIMLLIFRND